MNTYKTREHQNINSKRDTIKKYEITDNCKFLKRFGYAKVCEIKAVRDFGEILKGDLGGWVQCEQNLSHDGLSWITDDAMAFGNARVEHDAMMIDQAIAFDDAYIMHSAIVADNSEIFGGAGITGFAIVTGNNVIDSGNTNENGHFES